ncbi:hypothetical protein GCM10009001_00630 [Virgibacillus siamensis]|uniref:Uncharacterized protein n=1 Tax=Virgibacillus siamensis TaxID=480071 RepID=A0ABN1FDJ7_9BACI
MNLGPKSEHPNSESIYGMAIFPILFGLFASVSPTTSAIGFWLLGLYIFLCSIIALFGKKKELHYYVPPRVIYMIIQIDVAAICIIVLYWRSVSRNLFLLLSLTFLMVIVAYIGSRFSKIINQELRAPKTGIGKGIYAFGSVGAGIAGISGYVIGQGSPSAVIISILYVFMLAIVLMFHAQWLFIKEPYWRPE